MTNAQKVQELRALIITHRNALNELTTKNRIQSTDFEPHLRAIRQAKRSIKKLSTAQQLDLFREQ